MNISKGIQIIDTALWMPKEKVLIVNDLHLGYEEVLHRKGILVPKFQLDEIILKLKQIFAQAKAGKTKSAKIIINGDLKHEFGTVLKQEWEDVLELLDFCLKYFKEVIIIKGNHDPIVKPIADKRGVKVVTEYKVGDVLVVHGDELTEVDEIIRAGKRADKIKEVIIKRIIIGHEHPAITIREGSKWEKYKCFLKGKWKGKELIAVPSFNPLLEGMDVLKGKMLSPFLENIANFNVFVVNKGEVFEFGKVKGLGKG